eukprot:Em0043g1a
MPTGPYLVSSIAPITGADAGFRARGTPVAYPGFQRGGCLRLVHAFTCAGMLPRQYMNFSLFAGMGVVKQKYISSVYLNKLYQQVVADVAEESMKAAVERVKESPHHATSGETAAQSSSYPQVIAQGLNITEVAHGYQATIKQYVQQLGMVNSYDTWHGTKNVAKQLHCICASTVRTRDRTWFTELFDKARCTKVHLYWCMRNCGGNPDCLRAMIVNISKHFQPGYVPQRKPLTMPAAISVYEAALRKTLIYKKRLGTALGSEDLLLTARGDVVFDFQ